MQVKRLPGQLIIFVGASRCVIGAKLNLIMNRQDAKNAKRRLLGVLGVLGG
jgi:hypothetical protein